MQDIFRRVLESLAFGLGPLCREVHENYRNYGLSKKYDPWEGQGNHKKDKFSFDALPCLRYLKGELIVREATSL